MVDPQLAALINTVQLTDVEIRTLARKTAKESARIIKSLEGVTGPGAKVRAAQVALANQQVQMWAGVKSATTVGIGDAFDAATAQQVMRDVKLFEAAGVDSRYWEQSMLATSRSGIDSYLARKQNTMTLSQRVYRNSAISSGDINNTINTGLALGKSSREIANDVAGYINPDVPGGVSAAAMRLGRTEVSNAYHITSINQFQSTPWVENVQWNLSGSHTVSDECDDYAESSHIPGGAAGVYLPGDVPLQPHPNCLCFLTPIEMSLDKYKQQYQSGAFDDYINEQMGCSNVA